MNGQEADQLLAMLIATTNGWTDDQVDVYSGLMQSRWPDIESAMDAVNSVMESWTKVSRPPWAVLHEAYRAAHRRRVMDAPALTSQTPRAIVPFEEGRKIAARAYASERRRQGKEPNQQTLDSFLGLIPHEENEA